MPMIYMTEYCSTNYNTSFNFDQDEIDDFMKECRQKNMSVEEAREAFEEWLDDNKWDNQEDRELDDENTDDWEWDDSFNDVVDDFESKYEESLTDLGDFGND